MTAMLMAKPHRARRGARIPPRRTCALYSSQSTKVRIWLFLLHWNLSHAETTLNLLVDIHTSHTEWGKMFYEVASRLILILTAPSLSNDYKDSMKTHGYEM